MASTKDDLYQAFMHGLNASTSSNPLAWLSQWSEGGRKSDSGIAVNYNSSLTYAYVWAAVSMISRDVASKSLNVYSVDESGGRDVDRMSSVHWLLNGRPNDYMTAFTFRELLTSHALMFGNGYAFIGRNGAMQPTSLTVMLPDSVDVVLDEAGRLWYEYKPREYRDGRWVESGKKRMIPGRDVFHLQGLGWDGLSGHSVISLARNSWGLGMSAQRHGSKFFASGAQPSIVLRTDAKLNKQDADQLLDQWDKRHKDEIKPALLSHGLEVKPFSMSNEDSQWIESRAFQRVEVAVWFGIPPHKLGDSSRTAYNSLESEERAYINQTLQNWLVRWETEAQAKLLAERVQRNFSKVIKHDTADIPSSDIETRTDIVSKLRAAEIINKNEGRRMLGLPPVEGGEDFTNPNVRPAGQGESSQAETMEGLSPEARVNQQRLLANILSRIVGLEKGRAIAAAKKQSNFCEWVDEFYGENGYGVTKPAEMLAPILDAYQSLPGVECEFTVSEIVANHARESRELLLEVAGYSTTDSLVANIEGVVDDWAARAEKTATTIIEG